MKDFAAIGPYVQGRIDAERVPKKVIQMKTEIHPSTLSRFFNGLKPLSDVQLLEVGIAIGEARFEARAKTLIQK